MQALRFTEKPDYLYLKGIFCDLLYIYYDQPFSFDWNLKNPLDSIKNIREDPESIRKQKYEKVLNNNKIAYIFTDSMTEDEVKGNKFKIDYQEPENRITEEYHSEQEDKTKEGNKEKTLDISYDGKSNSDKTEENSFYDSKELDMFINSMYTPNN